MVEIYPRLFIGSDTDYEMAVAREGGWWVVHACKERYHRRLLGYHGRGAPKGHPEYLVAKRGRTLFLNLVDAEDANYIPKEIVDTALRFIDKGLTSGGRVLVHCNQGESRSPALGLLYLAAHTDALPRSSLPEAEAAFRRIYSTYSPKRGMRGFLLNQWNHYVHAGAGAA